MIVSIDTDNVGKLVKKGEEILFKPEAEKALLELLELEATVKAAIDDARHNIETAALKKNKNFSSVVSDKIKVGYRFFGSKYKIGKGYERELSDNYPNLINSSVRYSINAKELEKFEKESGSVPMGIEAVDRKKQITIKRVGEDE